VAISSVYFFDSLLTLLSSLLPSVFGDADSLIALFADKTIKEHGLAALIGAHTTSQQRFVDPTRAFDPQDSTPGVWDVLFYNQTLQPNGSIPARVFKFPSDVNLSQHPDINPEWVKFVNNQSDWNEDFSREYVRLSLLGVNVINDMVECTKVLPAKKTTYSPPDATILANWLKGQYPKLGSFVNTAVTITNQLLSTNNITPTKVKAKLRMMFKA
jgi:hypothetical protein